MLRFVIHEVRLFPGKVQRHIDIEVVNIPNALCAVIYSGLLVYDGSSQEIIGWFCFAGQLA